MEIDEKVTLSNNTLVSFDLKNGITGFGVIKGIATNGVPILGKSYIVEILLSYGIDKEIYPYSYITVFEKFMELKSFK